MAFRIAINGYGRIGQAVLRAIYADARYSEFKVVAINEQCDSETLGYVTRYDTTYGRFPVSVEVEDGRLVVNGDPITLVHQQDAARVPWSKHAVDLVIECSGSFTDRSTAETHLASGAQRLLISQPAWDAADATIIHGFNGRDLHAGHRVVSAGSCTTNCVVHVLRLLDEVFGVKSGVSTTIHSAMNDQPAIDRCQADALRLNRGAINSIVPVETGLGQGVGKFFPHLKGRFESHHLRVPTTNVSLMDLTITLATHASAEKVNEIFREAAQGGLRSILGYTEEQCVSVDYNHDSRSCIIDGTQTRVCDGSTVKVFAWFDNEYGYANRMLDIARLWLASGRCRQ